MIRPSANFASISGQSLGCILGFWFLLVPAPAARATASLPAVRTRPVAARVSPVVAPLWGDFRSFSRAVQLQLGNPRRMGQLAILGVCLGLFILMRK